MTEAPANTSPANTTPFDRRMLESLVCPVTQATLTYDAEGRLRQTNLGGSITNLLYDGVALIGEYDASGNLATRGINIKRNVPIGIFSFQKKELRLDDVCGYWIHIGSQHDDSIFEQAGINIHCPL